MSREIKERQLVAQLAELEERTREFSVREQAVAELEKGMHPWIVELEKQNQKLQEIVNDLSAQREDFGYLKAARNALTRATELKPACRVNQNLYPSTPGT